MKSPARRGNRKSTAQPVTIVNDTKYITKISERTIPRKHPVINNEFESDTMTEFLNLYRLVCVYIFLFIAIAIGGGGIAVCVIYFNSAENTQSWKTAGIVLGAVTCIVAIILIILTIFKQTHNSRPWRYKLDDIMHHPENYFAHDIDEISIDDLNDDISQNNIIDHKDQAIDTSSLSAPNTSYGLLKTIHNDLVYCLGCNHLHPSTHECTHSADTINNFSTLSRSVSYKPQRDSLATQTKAKSLKKNKSRSIIDRSTKYSITNDTQTDISPKPRSNTTDNLIVRRIPIPTAKVLVQQPTTKIMIVRVPNVAGELIIQPKEH